MTELQHTYEVKTLMPRRIVDGDTWWAYVDLGFRQLGYFEFRLMGFDTPEKQGTDVTFAEKQAAKEATDFVVAWWTYHISQAHRRIFVRTEPDPEKYGRWLASLWAETPVGEKYWLGGDLMAEDLAVISDGTDGTRWRDAYIG